MSKRSTDAEAKTRFRSDRFVCQNGLFFFTTREGTMLGPFRNREKAEEAAAAYASRRHAPAGG